ncbi:MAG TPA: hypothetical protein VLX60_06385 [Terriglobales bacterium]|nr:hypothetical protein [Terriglobales bacterium]
MQDQLRTNRQILYDLASRYLEPLPGCFARLIYLAGLRNPATERYEHPDLSLVYHPEAVHQALAKCHEELFERTLELSLMEQKQELIQYLDATPQPIPEDRKKCRELFEKWIPLAAPNYLKELFQSNLLALCDLLHERNSKARSGK